MVKLISKMLTWEFIILSFIVFLAVVLLSGCSTFVTTTVGDHTFESGVWIDRSFNESEEVQRDD